MIKGALIGDFETVERINRIEPTIRRELSRSVERLSIKLSREVKQNKLSGQVLQVRTGRLRRSINYRVAEEGNGIYGYVGTNVEYGRAWELGFKAKIGAGARGGPRTLKGKALESYMQKHPPGVKEYAPRSFLRSALAEMADEIKQEIRSAAISGAKKA